MRVCVVTPWWEGFVAEQVGALRKVHDVRVVPVSAKGPRWLVAVEALLDAAWPSFRGWRPDVVHSYSAWPAGIVGAGIAFNFNVPHIVHEHRSPAESLLRFPLALRVLRECDRVVVPSEWQREKVERISGRPCIAVANPIMLDVTQYWIRALWGYTKVLCLGRLEEQKGFDRVIRAAPLLPPKYIVSIVGAGSQEKALRALAIKERANNVSFCPPVPKKFVASVICSHDVVVCPSRDESYGMVAAEAWTMGIPVVATDVGAHHHFSDKLIPSVDHPPMLAEFIQAAATGGYTAWNKPAGPVDYDGSDFTRRMTGLYSVGE